MVKLLCAALVSAASCMSAYAQQWIRGGETLSGNWFIDATSVKVIAPGMVFAWIRITSHKDLPSPSGIPVRHVQAANRFHCKELWSEVVATEARTQDEFPVDSKTNNPSEVRRQYPSPGSPGMYMLEVACGALKQQ